MNQKTEQEIYKNIINKYIVNKNDFEKNIVDEKILLPVDNLNKRHFRIPYDAEYEDIYLNYRAQKGKFWDENEISISVIEIENLKKTKEPIKKTIIFIFKGFSVVDSYVNINVEENILSVVQPNEIKSAYIQQMSMEETHAHLYGRFFDQFLDEKEKEEISQSFDSIKSIKKLIEWCQNRISNGKTFTHILISFLAFESINFFPKFAIICWLRSYKESNFKCIIRGNDFVRMDEMLHLELAILIYKHLNNKLKSQVIHDIFKEAVDNEIEYINECVFINEKGLNKELLIQYTKYLADTVVKKLNVNPIYNIDNPLIFLEKNLLYMKTSQFEDTVTNYNSGKINKKDNLFEIYDNDDF